jgi:hypothetical protein
MKHSLLVWTTKNRKRCIGSLSNSSSHLLNGHRRDSFTQRIEAQYAWIQHVALAKVIGVSEEQIHSLQQGGHVKDEPHQCYWAKKLIDTNVWYTGIVFLLACFYSGKEMHYGHRCQNTAGRSAWRHD